MYQREWNKLIVIHKSEQFNKEEIIRKAKASEQIGESKLADNVQMFYIPYNSKRKYQPIFKNDHEYNVFILKRNELVLLNH